MAKPDGSVVPGENTVRVSNSQQTVVSLTPVISDTKDPQYSIHKLLLGTHTSEGADNYVLIANVKMPNEDAEIDVRQYDEEHGGLWFVFSGLRSHAMCNRGRRFRRSRRQDFYRDQDQARG
jgi:hypothetical protein